MKYAFRDAADGYYEVELASGEPLPAWARTLTPCPVQDQPVNHRPAVLALYRVEREVWLNRLTGIRVAYIGDPAEAGIAQACKYIRNQFLDLPAHPSVAAVADSDEHGLEAAILLRKDAIITQALTDLWTNHGINGKPIFDKVAK